MKYRTLGQGLEVSAIGHRMHDRWSRDGKSIVYGTARQ